MDYAFLLLAVVVAAAGRLNAHRLGIPGFTLIAVTAVGLWTYGVAALLRR